MPYQQLIPRPTDQLNVSQGDIQTNFLEIYNWVAVNHAQFDTANSGKHTQVTLPENAAPTATGLNELNIWSQVSANTGNLELTWQRALNQPVLGPGKITEMTAARAEPVFPKNGWSMTASGLLLKWGFDNSTGTGFVSNFPLNINGQPAPVFSSVFMVNLTPFSNNAIGITLSTFNNASITVNTFQTNLAIPAASQFCYLAIGVPA